jgi:hypothetical protein
MNETREDGRSEDRMGICISYPAELSWFRELFTLLRYANLPHPVQVLLPEDRWKEDHSVTLPGASHLAEDPAPTMRRPGIAGVS